MRLRQGAGSRPLPLFAQHGACGASGRPIRPSRPYPSRIAPWQPCSGPGGAARASARWRLQLGIPRPRRPPIGCPSTRARRGCDCRGAPGGPRAGSRAGQGRSPRLAAQQVLLGRRALTSRLRAAAAWLPEVDAVAQREAVGSALGEGEARTRVAKASLPSQGQPQARARPPPRGLRFFARSYLLPEGTGPCQKSGENLAG